MPSMKSFKTVIIKKKKSYRLLRNIGRAIQYWEHGHMHVSIVIVCGFLHHLALSALSQAASSLWLKV